MSANGVSPIATCLRLSGILPSVELPKLVLCQAVDEISDSHSPFLSLPFLSTGELPSSKVLKTRMFRGFIIHGFVGVLNDDI